MSFFRRSLALLALLLTLHPLSAEVIDPKTAKSEEGTSLLWYDIRPLGIEGQGWKETKAPFDRLPAKAEGVVRDPVWRLSRHAAGLCVRFQTDASTLQARWTLTSEALAMPHMPATGVSGVDLYVRDSDGKWKWLAVGQPTRNPTGAVRLFAGIPAGTVREYLLYLPLYNGVSSVEIGIPKENKLLKATPRPTLRQKPILFYGTSIVQGGCASRPGMVHTAILGRKLDWSVINLGFSGNGRMELELARLLAEVDAAVYVLDCLPNITAKEVEERTGPFVHILRKARPYTPIVLMEDRTYANAGVLPGPRERNNSSRAALAKAYNQLSSEGVTSLHYVPGEKQIGEDGEGTVDGSHPTDLGFLRMAEMLQPILTPLLPTPEPSRAPLEGYTNQQSYQAGDEIEFHISSALPTFNVEINRVGAERTRVWKKEDIAGKQHPIPADASSHGCNWPTTFTVKVPAEWRSGYYSARLQGSPATGKPVTSEVFFVVRSANPGKDAKILLQLATNTYNAYCNWGGYSLYAYNGRNKVQGRRVSFDRPIAGQFGTWELPFVQWVEKAGYKIDYAVNNDLEFHPELLKHYKLVLSVGHDEYWSAPMRDSLEKYIAAGGNVAFLSGNTCCWQVRSEDKGRALVSYKQAYQADPLYPKGDLRLLSTLWSHYLVKRPENELTGVGFLFGGYHLSHGQFMNGSGAFTVHRPEHWLFEGANVKKGDAFGGKDTIVGYECDGCELTLQEGLPVPTHRDGTPRGFQIVATAPARWHPDDCEWYEKWEKGRTGNAVMGLYTRGGTVITVGTTDWAHGLRGNDPVVVRVSRNIIERLGK